MSDLADYGENLVLDKLFGSGVPATLYFAAFTTMPAEDGTGGVEPAGGSYARASIANNSTNFPAASGSKKENAAEIIWPEATGDWGDIIGVGIYDADTAGNLIALKTVDTITVATGDRLMVDIGDFEATAD